MTCFRFNNGKTVHKWCLQHNIPYNQFWRRIEMGLSVEEACSDCLQSKTKKELQPGTKLFFIYEGVLYEGFFVKMEGDLYVFKKTTARINRFFKVPKAQIAKKTMWG